MRTRASTRGRLTSSQTSYERAVAIAQELGEAVALKVASPTLLHKSDAGGVALGIRGDEEVRKAFQAVTAVTPDADGALIQEYVKAATRYSSGWPTTHSLAHSSALGSAASTSS